MNQNEMKESHHIINITWFFFVSTQLEWKTKDLKNEWYEWILNDNVFEYYEFGNKVIATIISNIILFYIQKRTKKLSNGPKNNDNDKTTTGKKL